METNKRIVDPCIRCRLCAADEAFKVDIFGVDGLSRKLVDKIQTCLPIAIVSNDRLPKSICYRCMYLLEKFYEFRQACLNANDLLEDCILQYELHNVLEANTKQHELTSIEKHVAAAKKKVPNDSIPRLDAETSPNATAMESEGSDSPAPDTNSSDIEVLSNAASSKPVSPVASTSKDGGEVKNTQTVYRTLQRPKGKQAGEKTPRVLSQSKSGIVTSTPLVPGGAGVIDLTEERLSTERGRARRRSATNDKSLLKETLLRNEKRSRRRSSSVEIEEVEVLAAVTAGTSEAGRKRRPSIKVLENADRRRLSTSSLPNGSLLDEEAGASRRKSAKPRRIARPHHSDDMDVDDGDRPYSCMLCEKSFTLKNALSRHFNAAHGDEMTESRREQDVEYIEGDEGGAQVSCEICFRTFQDKASMWLHLMYSHRDVAPYVCGLCLKVCLNNVELSRHWKSHYSAGGDAEAVPMDRRYSCEICGRQDNSRKKLVNHLKIHVFDSSLDPDMLVMVNADYYNADSQAYDFGDDDEEDDDDDAGSYGNDGGDFSPLPYHPCNLCFKAFETEETLLKHRRTVHKSVTQCQVCEETFETEMQLMQHVTTEHYDGNHMLAEHGFNPFEPLVGFHTDEGGVGGVAYCKHCSLQFPSSKEAERHQRGCKADPKRQQENCSHHCELCSKSFISEDCLVKHKKGAHKIRDTPTPSKPLGYNSFYFCELCGSSHPTKVHRWRHVVAAHSDEAAIRCDYADCGKIFACETLAVEHRSHHDLQGPLPSTCELCGKLWNSRVEYWKHIQGVHPEMMPYICGVCLKMYNDTASLIHHVKTAHTPLDPVGYHCPVCARQYTNQSKCSRHQKIHDATAPKAGAAEARASPEKAVKKRPVATATRQAHDVTALWCDACPETSNFPTLSDLADHRRVAHSLHPCDLCPKFYGRNSHLWKHVDKIHRGDPLVTCDLCQTVSATIAQLALHHKKMHRAEKAGDCVMLDAEDLDGATGHILSIPTPKPAAQAESYSCELCEKTFLKRYLLNKHMTFCSKRSHRAPRPSVRHPCDRCPLDFPVKSRLDDHIRSAHKVEQCSLCESAHPSRTSLLRHVTATHEELRCATCGRFTRNPEDRDAHREQHETMEDPPCCEACGEVTATTTRMWSHQNAQHKDDLSLLCGVCFARLPCISTLRAHVSSRHPDALHADNTCAVCGKTYSRAGRVLEHFARFHPELRACRQCLSVFDDEESMRRHVEETHRSEEDEQKEPAPAPATPSTPPPVISPPAVVKEKADKPPSTPAATPSPRQRTKRSYSCDRCALTFAKPSELSVHRRRLHTLGGPRIDKNESTSEEQSEEGQGDEDEPPAKRKRVTDSPGAEMPVLSPNEAKHTPDDDSTASGSEMPRLVKFVPSGSNDEDSSSSVEPSPDELAVLADKALVMKHLGLAEFTGNVRSRSADPGDKVPKTEPGDGETDCLNSLEDALAILEAQNSGS